MKQLEWRIRLACAERNIWSAAELRHLVYRRTGVNLSPPTVQACFHGPPARIDVRTLTAILNALACSLEDLIRFTPPQTDKETRATPEEAARYQRQSRSASPAVSRPVAQSVRASDTGQKKPSAKAKRGATTKNPSPDIKGMLDALAETSEPLVAEQLQQSSLQPSLLASKKEVRRKKT